MPPGQPGRVDAALAALVARPATRAALAQQAAAPRRDDDTTFALAALALANRPDLVALLVEQGCAAVTWLPLEMVC